MLIGGRTIPLTTNYCQLEANWRGSRGWKGVLHGREVLLMSVVSMQWSAFVLLRPAAREEAGGGRGKQETCTTHTLLCSKQATENTNSLSLTASDSRGKYWCFCAQIVIVLIEIMCGRGIMLLSMNRANNITIKSAITNINEQYYHNCWAQQVIFLFVVLPHSIDILRILLKFPEATEQSTINLFET